MRGTAQGRVRREPFRGARHTVDNIRRLAVACQEHYPLRLLAEEIVGRLESKDFLSEILAVNYWVLGHTRYANDPRNVELVRSPREILERLVERWPQIQRVAELLLPVARGQSRWRPSLDCDDLVCLMVGLFLCLGRQVEIVTVAFHRSVVNGERQFSHVLLRVKEPRTNTYVIIDPVAAEDTAAMLSRVVDAQLWAVA